MAIKKKKKKRLCKDPDECEFKNLIGLWLSIMFANQIHTNSAAKNWPINTLSSVISAVLLINSDHYWLQTAFLFQKLFSKISNLLNIMSIFRIIIENASQWVQLYLWLLKPNWDPSKGNINCRFCKKYNSYSFHIHNIMSILNIPLIYTNNRKSDE